MRIKQGTAAVAAAFAIALGGATAADAKLPRPRSTTIVPNGGLGAVRLDGRLRPFPRGWSKPDRCIAQRALSGCGWTANRAGFPTSGVTGITGPFILAMALDGRVGQLTISAGDRRPNAAPLRRWRTRDGIGFTSTVDQLRQAYPAAVRGRLADQWVLWTADRGRRTNFRFADGRLRQIEIISCVAVGPNC